MLPERGKLIGRADKGEGRTVTSAANPVPPDRPSSSPNVPSHPLRNRAIRSDPSAGDEQVGGPHQLTDQQGGHDLPTDPRPVGSPRNERDSIRRAPRWTWTHADNLGAEHAG